MMTPPASTMTHGRAGVTRGGEEEAARGMADSGVASAPMLAGMVALQPRAGARSTDYFHVPHARGACQSLAAGAYRHAPGAVGTGEQSRAARRNARRP